MAGGLRAPIGYYTQNETCAQQEPVTAVARFPPWISTLYGHACHELFIPVYNEKMSFRVVSTNRCFSILSQKRAVSLRGLRGLRCSESSEMAGGSRPGGAGVGPAPPRTLPGPNQHLARSGFFFACNIPLRNEKNARNASRCSREVRRIGKKRTCKWKQINEPFLICWYRYIECVLAFIELQDVSSFF